MKNLNSPQVPENFRSELDELLLLFCKKLLFGAELVVLELLTLELEVFAEVFVEVFPEVEVVPPVVANFIITPVSVPVAAGNLSLTDAVPSEFIVCPSIVTSTAVS